MIKSKDKKTNPLDQITKRIENYVETYDSPLVHDPLTNSFKTENQMKLEAGIKENNRVIDTLNKYEDDANIPRQSIKPSTKKLPVRSKYKAKEQGEIPLNKRKAIITTQAVYNNQMKAAIDALENLKEIKNQDAPKPPKKEVDPDLYKGLGNLLIKKGNRNIF